MTKTKHLAKITYLVEGDVDVRILPTDDAKHGARGLPVEGDDVLLDLDTVHGDTSLPHVEDLQAETIQIQISKIKTCHFVKIFKLKKIKIEIGKIKILYHLIKIAKLEQDVCFQFKTKNIQTCKNNPYFRPYHRTK